MQLRQGYFSLLQPCCFGDAIWILAILGEIGRNQPSNFQAAPNQLNIIFPALVVKGLPELS
jgi:hypothetical protein